MKFEQIVCTQKLLKFSLAGEDSHYRRPSSRLFRHLRFLLVFSQFPFFAHLGPVFWTERRWRSPLSAVDNTVPKCSPRLG